MFNPDDNIFSDFVDYDQDGDGVSGLGGDMRNNASDDRCGGDVVDEKKTDGMEARNGNLQVDDDVALIRAMLMAARTGCKNSKLLPTRLYESTTSQIMDECSNGDGSGTSESGTQDAAHSRQRPKQLNGGHSTGRHQCVVCLDRPPDGIPTPCGHMACCVPCLTTIRNRRDGCPICRARIVTIASRAIARVS